jgi:L-alanine-DL-glutamate epimerase-like enolase superfamily enzyme
MTDAPRLRIREIRRYEWPFRLRMPFRFGVITVTEGRQAVVRVRVATEGGKEAWGVAAESLAAKWFDKDPSWSDQQNMNQLRRALEIAERHYLANGLLTAFGHFAATYEAQLAAGAAEGLNPLVAGFGPALMDRAVLDALCRIESVSFSHAMKSNLPGIAPFGVAPDLAGFDFGSLLDGLAPAPRIALRHTVGLLDPITAADVAHGDRVSDGLPQTLKEVVATYRPRYFKLKVGGKLDADLDRLAAIARVLDRSPDPYFASLDGNEQYRSAEDVLALWQAMARTPSLHRLCASILFIEQPITRAAALDNDIRLLRAARPVIIDESDGTIDAFPRARALGYDGVSSKACKGFYKSVLNLARCRIWNEAGGENRYFLSGEDLTTLAGVSVQQDLALASLLGITHIERNGHHYIDGFAGRPDGEARAFLAAHPSLYHGQDGRIRLKIENGEIDIRSLDCPGFAVGAPLDIHAMEEMPRSAWRAAPS